MSDCPASAVQFGFYLSDFLSLLVLHSFVADKFPFVLPYYSKPLK